MTLTGGATVAETRQRRCMVSITVWKDKPVAAGECSVSGYCRRCSTHLQGAAIKKTPLQKLQYL